MTSLKGDQMITTISYVGRWALIAGFAATLAACGGGDGKSAKVVTAAADAFTLGAGQTGALLANDRVDGVVASAATGGNVSFALTSVALPAGMSVSAIGVVSVGAGAVPGSVSLSYRICDTTDNNNCATANAAITVPPPVIAAVADAFTLAAGGNADVLANDTLGGVAASASTVTASATGALPAGISLSASGVITVANAAVAGTYGLGYRICQTAVPSNCATATATVTVPLVGVLSGRAVDAATGLGIAGVSVRVGALSATTGALGAFSLPGVPVSARAVVQFMSSNYADTVRITAVGAGTDVQARLLPVATNATVNIATGGTVTVVGSTAQVVLPAAGVQRADGSLPSGNMTVRLTPIDPASDISVMPGDFTTLVGGVVTLIESFGAISVELVDSAGVALNLRSGQTASIRIPLATRSPNPPATVPLFFFDDASGRWLQEGTATLTGTAPNRYYQGTVNHFSIWNADQVMETVQVTGCVADATGARLSGASVFSEGVDYSGASSVFTDSAGNFTIPIRRSSLATLVSVASGLLSNTLGVGPFAANTTLPACLALGQTGAGITMKLTWGALPDDLDSYLITPSGTTVYYSNEGSLTSAPFANLDVDDTSSYGPEVVTLTRLMVGTYKYAVNNYSGYGDGPIASSSARVELNIPGRPAELFTPPATGETASTDYWLVFEFEVDAQCNVTVRRQGSYTSVEPTAPTVANPTYCTRPGS